MNTYQNSDVREIETEFWRLVERLAANIDHLHDSREREPYLLDILTFVKSHSQHRGVLENCFTQIVSNQQWSLEILEFSMHELRWDSVRKAVEEALTSSGDIREKDALERVLSAFEPSWPDSDLYEYFRR